MQQNATKIELRCQLLAARAPLTQADTQHIQNMQNRLAEWIRQHIPAGSLLAGYSAMRDECSLNVLYDNMPEYAWCLPKIRPDQSLDFTLYRPAYGHFFQTHTHAWGVQEACGPICALNSIQLFLLPCVGIYHHNANYHRIGYGKGMYDRTLAYLPPGIYKIGIYYPCDIYTIADASIHQHDLSLLPWNHLC